MKLVPAAYSARNLYPPSIICLPVRPFSESRFHTNDFPPYPGPRPNRLRQLGQFRSPLSQPRTLPPRVFLSPHRVFRIPNTYTLDRSTFHPLHSFYCLVTSRVSTTGSSHDPPLAIRSSIVVHPNLFPLPPLQTFLRLPTCNVYNPRQHKPGR